MTIMKRYLLALALTGAIATSAMFYPQTHSMVYAMPDPQVEVSIASPAAITQELIYVKTSAQAVQAKVQLNGNQLTSI